MDQALFDFVKYATTFEKGVFLMISGVCFVFAVQFIFFLTVKIWMRTGKKKQDA